ncbi:hypothetical protein E2C01_039155 [Portunus trituberculatus]|uniref:Uncharacterized protein n=1 Tax=Portunus trituberculatus TaxID=210409 RepID=A0A5B7FJ39_PORTR|nr:hypothetical protein [Portunus trituberculatus]
MDDEASTTRNSLRSASIGFRWRERAPRAGQRKSAVHLSNTTLSHPWTSTTPVLFSRYSVTVCDSALN